MPVYDLFLIQSIFKPDKHFFFALIGFKYALWLSGFSILYPSFENSTTRITKEVQRSVCERTFPTKYLLTVYLIILSVIHLQNLSFIFILGKLKKLTLLV